MPTISLLKGSGRASRKNSQKHNLKRASQQNLQVQPQESKYAFWVTYAALIGSAILALAAWFLGRLPWLQRVGGIAVVTGDEVWDGLATMIPAIILLCLLAFLMMGNLGRRIIAAVVCACAVVMAALGYFPKSPTGFNEPISTMPGQTAVSQTVYESTGINTAYVVVSVLLVVFCYVLILKPQTRKARTVESVSRAYSVQAAMNQAGYKTQWVQIDRGKDPTDVLER